MSRIFRWLPHPHSWRDSRINPLTYTATEQQCRLCGKLRHHLYQDRFGPSADDQKWREGGYPDRKELKK